MTLKTKNSILNITTFLNFLSLILALYLVTKFKVLQTNSSFILLSITFLVMVVSLFIHLYFKKSLPSEIIFLTIFISALSLQSLRMLDFVISFETYMVSVLIGRISIFLKYIGLTSLLGTSLFSYSIKKQKIGNWLLVSILASGILSTILHFNTGNVEDNILPSVIFKLEEIILTSTTIILSFITLIKSSFDSKNKNYIYLAVAVLLLGLSISLTFISLALVPGLVIALLLVLGSVAYMISVHNISLWG